MTYSQRQRLAFIDWRLTVHGMVGRQHLTARFGISPGQASADLAAFERMYPDAAAYDLKARTWLPLSTRYRSVMGWTPRRLDAWAAAAAAGCPGAWA
jgi:hypothetical protein